jgi:L-threonylcarbamoyladenylate synthase
MNPFDPEIERCIAVLREGGVILYPTDTVWGLGCDATREDAVNKVFALKQRPDGKSLVVLLDQVNRLDAYVDCVPDAAYDLIEYAEKPLTIVYDGARNLARNVVAEDGSVAIRIVKDPFCRRLAERFRKPLVSTSANLSGQPPPMAFSEIDPAIVRGAGYVVGLRQHERSTAPPSTILRLGRHGEIRFLRR